MDWQETDPCQRGVSSAQIWASGYRSGAFWRAEMYALTMRSTLPEATDWSKIPALMEDRARNI
jgi:hypothetical protein